LTIEFDGEPLPFTTHDSGGLVTNTIELSYFGINQDGKAQRSTRSQFNLNLRPESFKRVKTGGLRLNPRMTLEPGRYQVRIGARETVGSRVGTVFYDLHVPDFRKEPLMLSGMLITATSAHSAMSAMPDPGAPKLLKGPAVSRRTFARNDTLTIFAEIYDNSSREHPHQIDARVSLVSETGQEVFGARDTIDNPSPALGTGAAGRWTSYGLTRDIPLSTVAPGRYLLKIGAKILGNSNLVERETLITVQ